MYVTDIALFLPRSILIIGSARTNQPTPSLDEQTTEDIPSSLLCKSALTGSELSEIQLNRYTPLLAPLYASPL